MATLDLKRSSLAPQACTVPAPLSAIQHVRKMRGGTQAHLMRGSDGNLYVVKFQTNPIHPRVLANELLATRLWFLAWTSNAPSRGDRGFKLAYSP
jgi:hypothetical protein